MHWQRIAFATFVLGAPTLSVLAEVRTWTDSTGKFTTEAEFVKYEDDQVTLRKGDKTVTFPFDRLSDDDQAFVEDLLDELESQSSPEKPVKQPPAKEPQPPAKESDAPTVPSKRVSNNVINSVRGAVYRDQTMKNLRQIGVAIVNYESTRGRYPAAAILSRDKKPLLSWRVAILPMLDEQGLHRQFKLDQPWDSEHNRKLIERMPSIFQSPGSDLDDGYTNYQAVVAPSTVISNGRKATRIRDVRDGTSKTVMIVETDDTYASIWTKPDDYDAEHEDPLRGLGNIWPSQFYGVFADGRVTRIPTSLTPTSLMALFTTNGGERVDTEEF